MRRILVGSPGLLPSLLLLILAPGHVARAGTAVRMDVPALVEGAEVVLEARVLSRRAVREPNGRIDTEYSLGVERTFLGEELASRAIRLPGGVLPDGRGMIVPGLPGLSVGEDVVLFLSRAGASGMRVPVGLAQGKLRIVTDPRGRRRLVRDQDGLELVDPRTGAIRAADGSAFFDYADVVARIEAASAAKRARIERAGR